MSFSVTKKHLKKRKKHLSRTSVFSIFHHLVDRKMFKLTSFATKCLSANRSMGVFRAFSLIAGRATPEETKKFITKSSLPLYHQLDKSKLYLSPIIHSYPFTYNHKTDNEYILALGRQAIVANRSNCVVVYHQYPNDRIYFYEGLPGIIESDKIAREQLVTIAHIGKATTKKEVLSILEEAKKLTHLEHLDIVMFEVIILRFNYVICFLSSMV